MTRPKNFKPSQSDFAKRWRATRDKRLRMQKLIAMLRDRGQMATRENVAVCLAEIDSAGASQSDFGLVKH